MKPIIQRKVIRWGLQTWGCLLSEMIINFIKPCALALLVGVSEKKKKTSVKRQKLKNQMVLLLNSDLDKDLFTHAKMTF